MVKHLQGAILAAGTGERLRKGGDDTPKPLALLGSETLLERQARELMRVGTESVIAIVNSETAAIIERERVVSLRGLQIIVRDTAHSMESMLTLGERLCGDFLMATVDSVIPPAELDRFVTEATSMLDDKKNCFDGVLGVVEWRGDRNPLFAQLSEERRIVALGEIAQPHVTAGVYLLPSSIFRFAEEARSAGLSALRRFLALLIDKGMRLGAVELRGVIDIDEPNDLAAARAALGLNR